MGFKGLLFIITIASFTIFAIQNRGAIALTFFGFNSVALPLWIWILLALFAGIISSLIINLLSRNPVSNNQRNQFPEAPYSPPPQPQARKQKSIPVEKSSQKMETPTEKLNYQWEEDEVFEDLPDNLVNFVAEEINPPPDNEFNNLNEPNEPIVSEETPEKKRESIEEIPNQNEELEELEELEEKQDINISQETIQARKTEEIEDVSPNFLKTREASPYSYQTREKTQIRSKTAKNPQNEVKPTPSPPQRLYQGVYDAPYRVIAPAQDEDNDNQDYYFEEDDEDWDF